MKITSIKQQVKQTNRYSIYIDDAYSFSLSESLLLSEQLVRGQQLTTDQVTAYKQLSNDDKLFNRALRYVAMRPRSTGEVRLYLQRKEAPEPLILSIVDRLQDLDLLNDFAYAETYIRNRQLLRPTSRRMLVLELRKRYVAQTHIDEALKTNELSESVGLQQVIIKKRRQSKYQDNTKLTQYLARQGYGYSDIQRALLEEVD